MPDQGRSTALDGLRGYGTASVVLVHAILASDPRLVADVLHQAIQDQPTLYDTLIKVVLAALNGEAAVGVFFVISGIVLFRTLRAHYAKTRSIQKTGLAFLVRRFVRIWPVMAICILGTTVMFRLAETAWPGVIAAPTDAQLADNLLLIRFPVIGSTWTLCAEMVAAPLLVLCLLGVERLGLWICAVYFGYTLLALLKVSSLLFSLQWLIAGAPYIAAGVAIECGWLSALARSRLRWPVALLALALLGADALFVPTVEYKWRIARQLFMVTVLVALVYRARNGKLLALLQSRPSQYLGRISYSLYLWNVPVSKALLAAIGPDLARQHPLEIGVLLGLASFTLTIPLAHVSERWLEQPFIRLGRALAAGMSKGRGLAPLEGTAHPVTHPA
jgi:peptidoglycan/LPS O-acetylase OafA/YrhL